MVTWFCCQWVLISPTQLAHFNDNDTEAKCADTQQKAIKFVAIDCCSDASKLINKNIIF